MFASLVDPELIKTLKNGGVVVIPTDTTYGIVALAANRQAVERMYKIRGRSPQKPCIILAAGPWQITDNSLWNNVHRTLAARYWPGPLSIVMPTAVSPEYLHRGTHTLAYRVPNKPDLQELLSATGPLSAPSANPEGQPTATTLAEAKAYFSDQVDGYVDGGTIANPVPSTLVSVVNGKVRILRQGALYF